jgi:hypothetical protein
MCTTLATRTQKPAHQCQWLAVPMELLGSVIGKLRIDTATYVVRDLPDRRLEVMTDNGHIYYVELAYQSCTCRGHRIHGSCKHVRALTALYAQLADYREKLASYVERVENQMDW